MESQKKSQKQKMRPKILSKIIDKKLYKFIIIFLLLIIVVCQLKKIEPQTEAIQIGSIQDRKSKSNVNEEDSKSKPNVSEESNKSMTNIDEEDSRSTSDAKVNRLGLKDFDLSLRQIITKINGESIETERKITIEGLKELKEGKSTTAQYNQEKTPVTVKRGSVITYNINIYNESSTDGIATVIKQQLPEGVKLELTSLSRQLVEGKTQYIAITKKGNKYKIEYNEEKNNITFSLDKNIEPKNIEAFSKRETLDVDTIEFDCIVERMADQNSNIYLTSTAYICEERKSDGTIIENQTNLGQENIDYKGEQNKEDFEKLVIYPQTFDLKLIQYIEKVNEEDVGKRIIKIDTTKLNKTDENGRIITTAEYEMEKNPISVKALDFIKYTFRVYNEGDYDGYATEISGNIPQGLEALMIGKDMEGRIIIYSWNGVELKDVTEEIKGTDKYDEIIETNSIWGYSADMPIIKTTALKDELIKAYGINDYTKYADEDNKIDYKEASIIFRVKEDIIPSDTAIRSEAALTGEKAVNEDGDIIYDAQGNQIVDRDSNTNLWNRQEGIKKYNKDIWKIYTEDDEDYENIIVREFDLSLRSQLTKITRNGEDILYTERYAKLDIEAMKKIEQERIEKEEKNNNQLLETNEKPEERIEQEESVQGETEKNIEEGNELESQIPEEDKVKTIYDYYDVYNSKPKVRAGDILTYSIRIYNEEEMDGYASLIADKLPSGLEIVPYTEGDGSINEKYRWRLVEGTKDVYETDYLSYENDNKKREEDSNIIKGYTGSGEANYKEIEIQCKVKENVTKEDSLINVVQIADDSDDKGNPVKDKDSDTRNTDGEERWQEEDDLDIEVVELEEYDLSLKMFVGETKEEKSEYVNEEDVVIYTIRVYNKGEIKGYAQEITNEISENLEFLPNHEVNQNFKWSMYDKNGKQTQNVKKATQLKTRYLSKEENIGEDNSSTNLIQASDDATKLDYKDVKIAFKVKNPDETDYIITNSAKVTEYADEKGNAVIDRNADINQEDKQDIIVKHFNLELVKYINKIIINENGKQEIIETGNVGKAEDIIPKIEIDKSKIKQTDVEFVYTIKIVNKGNIAGYAKEITDYIPDGLEFNIDNNPTWDAKEKGIISTKRLEKTILQPGESAEVEVVLGWKNKDNNLGTKVNKAKITEDKSDEENGDIDSIQINQSDKKEDIAEAIISIKTGGGINKLYINLILIWCVIIIIGIVLIKKWVL
ncbi:MAG: hypothetical protein HFJ48_01445 [Clostridia bacterium]|nr:hypothetical protein [Clostridia bacterium]